MEANTFCTEKCIENHPFREYEQFDIKYAKAPVWYQNKEMYINLFIIHQIGTFPFFLILFIYKVI